MTGLERRKSDNYSLAVCGPYDVTRGQFERCAALAMTEGRNTTGNLLLCADGCRRSDRAPLTAEEVWDYARRIREACGEVGR